MNINFRNPLKGFPSKFNRRQLVTLDSSKILNKEYFNSFMTLLSCPICKEVLSNPYDCEKCDNTFCFECISNNKCLFCEGDRKKIKQSSRGIKTMLSQLIFMCDCKSEIPYDEMTQHSSNCYGEFAYAHDEGRTTNETNLNININIPQFLRDTEKDFEKISKETLKLKNEISGNMDSLFKSLYKRKKKKENFSQEISSQENFNSSMKFDCVGDGDRKPKSFSDCLEISDTGGKNLLKKLDEIEIKIGDVFKMLNKDFFLKISENFDYTKFLDICGMNSNLVKESFESKFCNLNEMLKNCFREMKEISNKDFIKMEILLKRKEVVKEKEKDNLIEDKIKEHNLNQKTFEEILEVKNLLKKKIQSQENLSNLYQEYFNTLLYNIKELKEKFLELQLNNNERKETNNQIISQESNYKIIMEYFQKGFSDLKENQDLILVRLDDFKSKLNSIEQQNIGTKKIVDAEYKNSEKSKEISNYLNQGSEFKDMFKINWCTLCEKVDYFYGFIKCEICILTICKACISLCKQCKNLYCVQCLKCSQCDNVCCTNCRSKCSSCLTQTGGTGSGKSYCSTCISKCSKCMCLSCLNCLSKCFICNENICNQCSNNCNLCKISSCFPCGSIKDYITCPSCELKICFNCIERCMLCDLDVCTPCQFTCNSCNILGCLKNRTTCSQCFKAFCNKCNIEKGHILCYICNKNFCDACIKKNLTNCKKCAANVCRSCYSVCFKCKKSFCLDCKIRCDSCAEITCDTCSYLCHCEQTLFCEKCLFGINPVCKAECLFINGKSLFSSYKTRSNFSLPENFEAKFFVQSLYKENRLMIGLTDNSDYEEDSVFYIDDVWLLKIPTGEKFSTEKGIENFISPVKEKDFIIVTKIGCDLFFKINFVNSPVAFVLNKDRFKKYFFYLENDSSLLLDKTRVVLVYLRKL